MHLRSFQNRGITVPKAAGTMYLGGLKNGGKDRQMNFGNTVELFLTYLVFLSPQLRITHAWAWEACFIANY